MDPFTLVEDELIARIKAALTIGGELKVRQVESLPGDWDADMLRRLLRQVPGVFVAFSGGAPATPGGQSAEFKATWSVVVATAHASGEAARRRGDALQLGCYQYMAQLIPALHGHKIAEVGTLDFASIENLYTGEIDKRGLAVYAIKFTVPMWMPSTLDEATLAPFVTFKAQFDLPPLAGDAEYQSWLADDYTTSKPDSIVEVALEQPVA